MFSNHSIHNVDGQNQLWIVNHIALSQQNLLFHLGEWNTMHNHTREWIKIPNRGWMRGSKFPQCLECLFPARTWLSKIGNEYPPTWKLGMNLNGLLQPQDGRLTSPTFWMTHEKIVQAQNIGFARFRSKNATSDMQAFSDYHQTPYLSLPKELTASTNFWKKWMIANIGQKGRWGFMVSPIDIWSHPIGSGVWLTPLPIHCGIMPPSLSRCNPIASYGILLICTFSWYSKYIVHDQHNNHRHQPWSPIHKAPYQ